MKNVFSYKDEVVFTLLAPSNKVKNRYSDNYVTICGYDILKTAVVVGENAGGKSNFIKGIQYFKSFFILPHYTRFVNHKTLIDKPSFEFLSRF